MWCVLQMRDAIACYTNVTNESRRLCAVNNACIFKKKID